MLFLWKIFEVGQILKLIYIIFVILNVLDCIPSKKAMILQICVAMKAMPWYTLLPTFSEHVIEMGWTRCFPRISDVGVPTYLGYILIYLLIVEFGIYWAHRELHDIKPLYKYLHAIHHIYNKQNTLSPFAGQLTPTIFFFFFILLNFYIRLIIKVTTF